MIPAKRVSIDGEPTASLLSLGWPVKIIASLSAQISNTTSRRYGAKE